jgi:hypothetical protein
MVCFLKLKNMIEGKKVVEFRVDDFDRKFRSEYGFVLIVVDKRPHFADSEEVFKLNIKSERFR